MVRVRIALSFTLVLALLGVLACGEEEVGPSELTTAEYAEEVTELQRDGRARYEDAVQNIDIAQFDGEAEALSLSAETYTIGIAEGDRFFDAMNELTPPADLETAHDRYVDAWAPLRAFFVRIEEGLLVAESWDTANPGIGAEDEAAVDGPFETACRDLEDRVIRQGIEADFQCEYDWFFGGGEVSLGCEVIPVPGIDGSLGSLPSSEPDAECEPSPASGGFIEARPAAMPPLPTGLVAVSDYLELGPTNDEPSVAGFALPLTEDITDPYTVAFYSYVDGQWQRIAEVRSVSGGRAEGEFTTMPPNLAVLRETP